MLTTLYHAPLKTKSPLEEQAYEILTPFAFNKFQEEFERANQYLIVRVEGNDIIIRYFDNGNHKDHKVFWDGNIASCSCKHFEFWGILCRHIFRVFLHKDCFKIPPVYLPLRWSLDSLQNGTVVQRELTNDSLIDVTTNLVENEPEKRNNILCPPKSTTKGRPKKRLIKGGKELANKKRNKCSICKQIGHTKPTCDNKENTVDMGNISSNMPPKQKVTARDLGLNPVFTLKY